MNGELTRAPGAIDDDARAQQAMNWYGFGSPVGLAILIFSVSVSILCLRITILGLPW
jgi:hypothetical protein